MKREYVEFQLEVLRNFLNHGAISDEEYVKKSATPEERKGEKMKKRKRNLAFFKRSGEPWTQDEYENICDYVGDENYGDVTGKNETKAKYIFDDGKSCTVAMYPWSKQENHSNFKNCKQVAYEDVFQSPIESISDIASIVNDEQFTKADQHKNRLELIEPEFIKGLGRIVSFGSLKYSAENWKNAKQEDINRIKGALLRHIMDYLSGEMIDKETNESHLYHAACNLMFLDYFDRAGDQEQ